mmetsp:Transcript_3158/g.7947  ORF Transcript_3158/g.7947 Transcript_3158/m.7947 type:complete len:235 (+) Transcript_3158:1287-1991(+)
MSRRGRPHDGAHRHTGAAVRPRECRAGTGPPPAQSRRPTQASGWRFRGQVDWLGASGHHGGRCGEKGRPSGPRQPHSPSRRSHDRRQRGDRVGLRGGLRPFRPHSRHQGLGARQLRLCRQSRIHVRQIHCGVPRAGLRAAELLPALQAVDNGPPHADARESTRRPPRRPRHRDHPRPHCLIPLTRPGGRQARQPPHGNELDVGHVRQRRDGSRAPAADGAGADCEDPRRGVRFE